jgi:cytochrome P450
MDLDMDAQLAQEKQSELVRLYRDLGYSYRPNNGRWKILLPFQRRAMGRRLDRVIKAIIKDKFDEGSNPEKSSRSVLALGLAEHPKLTPEILNQTCDQLKSFLFAGHDTTSILLQWSFYQLSRTPRVLRLVCLELDEIFGPDSSPSVVRSKILERGEEILQRLIYTSAVIKEILRLFPPAATARSPPANSGMNVQLSNGEELCLDGTIIYVCHSIIQRDKSVYGDNSNEFIPERWLGGGKDNAPIPPSAWRPFERGPRNCIGQELANIEALVILASAVRRYDWEKVGLGAFKCDDSGAPIIKSNGQYDVDSELYSVSCFEFSIFVHLLTMSRLWR